MAASAQSITEALVGTPQGVPQLHTAGFGVTEAALDVFSNFVTHIAENALPTGAVSENLQPSPKQLRRSRRFAPTAEAPDTCPLALPAPLVQKVRFAASVSCCDGRQLGFCGGIHGYRLKPGDGYRFRPICGYTPLRAIISTQVDVQTTLSMLVRMSSVQGCHRQ